MATPLRIKVFKAWLRDNWPLLFGWSFAFAMVLIIVYSIVGTGYKVDEIKRRAPAELAHRGFTILHGESYEYGAWGNDGGKVWYHVAETAHPEMRYRMYVTMWNGELQLAYGYAEGMQHIDIRHTDTDSLINLHP